MIVCKKCGNQNPDNEMFCTSCRAFLEWSGEKVVEAPPPAPPPQPAEPEPQPGFVEKVKHAVGIEPAKADPPATVSPAPTPPSPPMPPASQPVRAYASPPSPAPVAAPAASSALEVPVTPQSPGPQAAAAVLPQAGVLPGATRPPQAPKTFTPAQERIKPGDVICGQCGAGNSPERHFCQRCGANLAAAVVVKQPWWRRFFPARTTTAAGTRHAQAPVEREWGSAFFRVVALGVVALLALAYVAVPPVHNKVNATVAAAYGAAHRQFNPTKTWVRPSDASASSQLSLHTARQSIDLITETYWAANASTDKQPTLHLSFATPVDFDQIVVTSGAAADYATVGRPKDVSIVLSNKSTTHLTLMDDPHPIGYDVNARGVTWVEIHILSVYATAQSPDVAINEVEFLRIT